MSYWILMGALILADAGLIGFLAWLIATGQMPLYWVVP